VYPQSSQILEAEEDTPSPPFAPPLFPHLPRLRFLHSPLTINITATITINTTATITINTTATTKTKTMSA